MYTVKQVAELAGVTVRTLHHYHEIGLLSPSVVGRNQYRYYDGAALLRLQQILLYREIGVELGQIKALLDDPAFDVKKALRAHREILRQRRQHLDTLIQTVEHTLEELEGAETISRHRLFEGFSNEQQADYQREIRLQYGSDLTTESNRHWNSYSDAEKQRIADEGSALYADIAAQIDRDANPTGDAMQAIVQRWHQHLRYFYEPPLEVLRGLPDLYTSHPDFIRNFEKLHPRLGDHMKKAILHYVDGLETREIERLYAEDAHRLARLDG